MNNRRGSSHVSNQRPRLQRRTVIHVSPEEIAFRVVCHASVISGIIGSNGHIVSNLRRETNTKIHCEYPANGSEHWVVFIVGSTAVDKSVLLTDRVGDFSGGEHESWVTCDVSDAQTALIRVLERSWVVLAAKDSGGIVVDSDGEDEAYCGILADRNQIGAVLGFGGKNVERMRRTSGAAIRVLPPPSCGSDNDELIQITGDVLAVKKALVMVSTALQNCPPLNGYPPPLCTKAYDSSIEGNSEDPHSEFSPDQRCSSLPNASETAATTRHLPPSRYREGNGFEGSKNKERKVVFKLICTTVAAGGIIGKQGTIIRAMENETGASISIGDPLKLSGDRVVTISARESLESRYPHAQKALAIVFARSVEIDVEKGLLPGLHNNGALVKAKLLVPSQFAYGLIRNRDTVVASGVDVHIPVGDQILDSFSENEMVIEIKGEYRNVQKALSNISSKLRHNVLPKEVYEEARGGISSNPYESVGTNYNLQPTQQNTNRGDSLLVSDVEQDLNMVRSGTEIMKSIDNLFKDANKPNGFTQSPRLVANELTQGMNQLQLSNNGDGSSISPRGSKGVYLKNVTLELAFDKDALGSLYGRDGAGLDNLQQISGAKVDVKDPTGDDEATVLISGTSEQTRAATSLILSILADE